jgi:phage terminase large subunit-like protein
MPRAAATIDVATHPKDHPSPPRSLERFQRFCGLLELRLEDFQLRIVGEVFDGTDEVWVLCPRGQGKTELLAAFGLFHLVTEPLPEVVVGAATRDQAQIMLRAAKRMAQGSPLLRERVVVRDRELRANGGHFKVLSADGELAHGLRPSLALIDEAWCHPTNKLITALLTARHKRGAPVMVISSAGYDSESTLGKLRRKALALPDIRREDFLTIARAPGFAFYEWSVPEHEDVADPEVAKRSNPASWISPEMLHRQWSSPGLHENDYRRFHCGQWVASERSWLPHGAWAKCAANYTIEDGEEVIAAVDVGGSRSATALGWVTPDLRVGIEIWQGEDAVLKARDAVPELCKRFRVREVLYDAWRFQAPALELAERGLPMIEWPTSIPRMTQSAEALYGAIMEGKLRHPNDARLNQHVNAAVVREAPAGIHFSKAKSRDQIDGLTVVAMAVGRVLKSKPPPKLLGWL